jgi:dTDP-glucose 4,6-dehydratase
MNNVLITGGAEFIGSNLVNYLVKKHQSWNFIILDKLTYSGNQKKYSNCIKFRQVLLYPW